jgi:hypothetical protein
MGKLLVVGSVALDTVKTPFGEVAEVLGGSATYFSTAASYFTAVDLIAVVGEDFPPQHVAFLKSRGIDLTGLERRPGATFRWQGEYTHQLNGCAAEAASSSIGGMRHDELLDQREARGVMACAGEGRYFDHQRW